MQLRLRPFQKQALHALEHPRIHVICVAATGQGKSLIYERYAATPGTRTVLVTPLVALARQQFQKLSALGISTSLGAGSPASGPPVLKSNEPGVWIISPEKLFPGPRTTSFQALQDWKPNFLVVDECHCLWEWGDQFRTAFAEIPEMIELFEIPKSLWLTATLPLSARRFIQKRLPKPQSEIGKFQLPENLSLHIRQVPWTARTLQLTSWVLEKLKRKEPGILFVPTRQFTLRLFRIFEEARIRSLIYHAGMSSDERRNAEKLIAENQIQVTIATSAFGMGMDHAHLKWAVLWQPPPSLLSLAQQVGRVGRGKQGEAHVFWDHDDFRLMEWMIQGSERRREDLLKAYGFLNTNRCRRKTLLEYFEGENADSDNSADNCKRCDHCLSHETPVKQEPTPRAV